MRQLSSGMLRLFWALRPLPTNRITLAGYDSTLRELYLTGRPAVPGAGRRGRVLRAPAAADGSPAPLGSTRR